MKTYNALSKSFTYEVKTKMGGGKSIDDAFNEIKDVNKLTHGDGKETGFYYVDLGLPSEIMWATCNVGADKPEDEGLLFQFGRVDGYKYGDENHQFRTQTQNTQDTGNSYIPLTTSGKTYNADEILDIEDDAAHVNMGGKWMMPTNDQLEELINNTTQEVETINGVQGMMFTSDMNEHKLFIPFTQGYWNDGTWRDSGWYGTTICSSQVYPSIDGKSSSAYIIECTLDGDVAITSTYRSDANSVRGVFKK